MISLNEIVLIELGAENHQYAADLTRTIPAKGKSNKEKNIYDLDNHPKGNSN